MDVDGLPIVGAALDLSKVSSIHNKRTLAFLNHFISHTVHFLNKFSCVCESKFEALNTRIQRIETSLCILEAKLSSIAGLETIHLPNPTSTALNAVAVQNDESHTVTQLPVLTGEIQDKEAEQSECEQTITENPTMTVAQDPRYAKYFKLIQVGVPPPALRPKMLADGLDPDLLDTPNAPAPPRAEDSDEELQSNSDTDDFSD